MLRGLGLKLQICCKLSPKGGRSNNVEARYGISENINNADQTLNLANQAKLRATSHKYSRNLTPLTQNKIAFTGSTDKFLSSLGQAGKNPTFPLVISALGALLFRVPIIGSDRKTPKEERTYAATWLAVMSAIGLGVQLVLNKPVGKFSDTIAKTFLNIKKPTTAQELTRVAGASKVFEFLSWVAVLNTVNIVIARYLKRGMDFINEKLKGKPPSKDSEKPTTPEEKDKQKKIDHSIFACLAAIGGFFGLNMIGRLTGRGPIATKSIISAGKKLNQAFNISGNLKDLLSKTKDSLSNLSKNNGFIGKISKNLKKAMAWPRSEKGLNWFANQADAPDKWLDRAILSNMIIRPLILIPTGHYFTVISSFVNEALALMAIKKIGKPVVDKLTPKLVSALKISADNPNAAAGAGVLLDQGIKNIGLVCIGMGFLNNVISRNMLKMFKKPDKDKQENSSTNNLKYFSNPSVTVKSGPPKDMDAWLKSLKYRPASNYFNTKSSASQN